MFSKVNASESLQKYFEQKLVSEFTRASHNVSARKSLQNTQIRVSVTEVIRKSVFQIFLFPWGQMLRSWHETQFFDENDKKSN